MRVHELALEKRGSYFENAKRNERYQGNYARKYNRR